MSCPRAAELMFLALEEEATPDERLELDAHLATCGACAAQWRALQAVEGLLARASDMEPPASLAPRIMQGVERHRLRRERWLRLRSFLYILAGCLALAAAPVLLIASALEHDPSLVQALVRFWGAVGAVVGGLAGAVQTFTRALFGGPCGALALAWVLLAALFALGWLRLVAAARATATKGRAA